MTFENRSILILLFVCFSFIAGSPSRATEQQKLSLLQDLKNHSKIKTPDTLLAPFQHDGERVDIIVIILPSAEAKALAEESANTSAIESNRKTTGGPVYYNLKNPSIQKQLRRTVKKNLGSFSDNLDETQITIKRHFEFIFGFQAEVTLDGLKTLADDDRVVSIEQNRILEPHLAQGIPLMNATTPRSLYNGSGLSIAICDSGIDTSHPRLGGGGFPIFNTKVIGGYDTGDNDADPRPSQTEGSAHGTASAGIAAGDWGTTGDYIGGVAPAAKLYALKISTGTGRSATASALIAAWEWCVIHQNDDPDNPIMIISTSYGSGRYFSICDSDSAAMTTAAAIAVSAGMTIFASSGNDGYCDSISWPSCLSTVNSVGAVYDSNFGPYAPCVSAASCAAKFAASGCSTGYYSIDITSADMVASYSNSASFLTLLAPANAAYTTDITGSGGYSDDDFNTEFGGTSAACPYAAGAAAVLQHTAKLETGRYLTPAQVRQYLTTAGNIISDAKAAVSKPRVNVGNAIAKLKNRSSRFPWHMFIPFVGPRPLPNPLWGADSFVCCSISPYTFSLTDGAVTKLATLQDCASFASWDGWETASPGARSFTWSTYGSCAGFSGSFSYTLQRGRAYLFWATWTGSTVEIWVSIYSINREGTRKNTKPALAQEIIAQELIKVIPAPVQRNKWDTDNLYRPAPESAEHN